MPHFELGDAAAVTLAFHGGVNGGALLAGFHGLYGISTVVSAIDEDIGCLADDGTDDCECGDELLFVVGLLGDVLADDEHAGYLNAFDVLVHTHATDSAPLLSSLIQNQDRKDLAHAGFLTLDRLVQRQPADMLARLAADRSLQQNRPEMAAQQFARGDLRDPGQREIVRTWLLDPARTATELGSFAGVYPNNNRFISNNLLTRESQQSGADLAAHDREALAILQSWTADPAFLPVKPQLLSMIERLNGFIAAPQSPQAPAE